MQLLPVVGFERRAPQAILSILQVPGGSVDHHLDWEFAIALETDLHPEIVA